MLKTKLILLSFFLLSFSISLCASKKDIGIDEFIGNQVPSSIQFVNSYNQSVTLNDFFSDPRDVLPRILKPIESTD